MIIIRSQHLEQICNHAGRTYPEECCGLLLGTVVGNRKIIVEVKETENDWGSSDFGEICATPGSRRNRFSIAPQVLLEVQRETRDRNLAIVGIYHSHPDSPAIPSEFDRALAWGGYSYLIVSVQQGQAVEVRTWQLDDGGEFQPENSMNWDFSDNVGANRVRPKCSVNEHFTP